KELLWLKRLVWLFLTLGAIYIAGRLLGPAGSSILKLYSFGSTGSLFWIWLVALAGGQALFNRDLRWQWRMALLGLVTATFVVALTGEGRSWTSGWLPPSLALAILVLFRWPRG